MSSGQESKPKKRPKKSSLLYDIFVGTYVNIALKNIKGGSSRPGKIANLMFAGYLLDEDEEYFYIGQTSDEVYAAVKKEEVAAIMLSDEEGDLMAEIEVPEGQGVQ